ncbi:MAG: glycosyl hydrolase [Chitinophagaceae bacterium]
MIAHKNGLCPIAIFLMLATCLIGSCSRQPVGAVSGNLESGFLHPPDSARPGVYWYFMDGNMSREKMTEDLESMKKVGIGHVLFLEVNVGIPRGTVEFFSDVWQELFKHAVREAERLGIAITLGVGPGWTGSGGPWVLPAESMQHLVSSTTEVYGAGMRTIHLPKPPPMKPFFGEGGFTPALKKQWNEYYADVAVLAFPTPPATHVITDINEKALYYRAPYSSVKGVKQFITSIATYPDSVRMGNIEKSRIIDLTDKLQSDGSIRWQIPEGNWTIIRFGSRNNGAVTRPAPFPGLGFESDKFDSLALDKHLDQFTGKILRNIGKLDTSSQGGLKTLHMDSWEMGSQNWTAKFRDAFIKSRGYDPLPYYPVYAGNIVESPEMSERFLWDLRLTSQELVIEQHATHLKKYAHSLGLRLSIEPYDMNPTADMELGAVADIPMCEFWSKGFGYNTTYSCIEAASIAHINGISLVPAEAFTAEDNEGWKQHPASMKEQGDWAFAAGINQFVFHTFQNQALNDSLKPGLTMGPYGIHWDRGQTWWPMVGSYHEYISRCQFVLQQGRTVADILYLTPEGAPHVFRPPLSALAGDSFLPDRKGYNFDGCSPGQLYNATVKDSLIFFPGGACYRVLVLPFSETMTPGLLEKIRSLVNEGATVIGEAPKKSPGLSGFPECDQQLQSLVAELWGNTSPPGKRMERSYGKGKVVWGGDLSIKKDSSLYPGYDATAALLRETGLPEDFSTTAPLRYTHRVIQDKDIYFVANRTGQQVTADCLFRTNKGNPELWDPLTGTMRTLPEYSVTGEIITVPLQLDAYQSFFLVFSKHLNPASSNERNFLAIETIDTLNSPWTVSFDTTWGGPANVVFNQLEDWAFRPENGIKYYSGTAMYQQNFDLDKAGSRKQLYLDLGEVKNIARVKLNGKDMGVVWTAPWKVNITDVVKRRGNLLEIEVVNLWANRLIGDEQLPDDGIKNGKWPEWLLQGKPRNSGRYTFTTYRHYKKDSPLLRSGLLGPVTIQQAEQ